ncbi:MAG TPA: carboxypeptidase regulatory-like domain-containing protein, partial [Woeseiaceae bacterium]
MRSEYRTKVVRQCTLAYLRLGLLVAVLVPALLMFGEPVAAQSDSASINGRVVNPASRSGMSGVRVRLVETGATTSTSNDGSFRFGSVPAGSYALELSYIGMDTEVEQVTVAAGQRLDQEFSFGPATMDEVVVTGIRGAQAAALNEQRNNDNISNVISADQLGRFPDRNIAEAMRRVPGVSIEREEKAGDGRYVSIRGLDSGLNNFKLNGMNVAQQEEDNRRIPLDVIQVEAVSMITVNKTLLPDHDGDGIGGAVEMTSATAFDFDRHHVDITAEGFYNDFRGDLGSKLAGTYSTVFGRDDRWGI